MILQAVSKTYYIDDAVALAYIKLETSVEESITDPRIILREHPELTWILASKITEKVDVTPGGVYVTELLALAEKYHLLFKGRYTDPMSPKEFARQYTTTFVTAEFYVVDYEDLRYELAVKEKELADKIAKLDAVSAERFDADEPIQPLYTLKRIDPTFNFSGWTDRLRTIRYDTSYDSDFWLGTDRTNGYMDELNSLLRAIDARSKGNDRLVLEVCGRSSICYYEFLVSDLISQERIDLHFKDFEDFRLCNTESFNSWIIAVAPRKAVYEYLVEHHT